MNRDKALRLFELAWPTFSGIMQGLAEAGGLRAEPETARPTRHPSVSPPDAAATATPTPAPRKSGRPRKAPRPAEEAAPAKQAARAAGPKRKPGRPRKSESTPERAAPAKRAARTAKAAPPRAPGGRRGAKAKAPEKAEGTTANRERVELLSRILTSVAKAFGVKELALLSKERGKELDLARAVAYYLTARLSGLPHPEIAGLFERDRVTLKSGIARVERLVSEDKELAAKIAKLEEGLRPKPTARAAAQ